MSLTLPQLRRRVRRVSGGTKTPETDDKFKSYGDWLRATAPELEWEWDHLRFIRERLAEVTNGECRKLILSAPPQHGKSTAITVHYPAYRLERNPGLRVAVGGYNQRHANRFSRKTRKLVRSRLTLDGTKAQNEWETANGGSYLAVGVGAGITGMPVDLMVIDDPVKSREEADSEAYRENVWEWYMDDITTRLQENAAIVIVMCMVGDTQVLMADGTEKPLRDIHIGDAIATYDEGRLGVSTVRNWINQGPDNVYEIRMKSGTIVKANERHPFLVLRDGGTEWVRLRNLKSGDQILRTNRVNGGSGKGLSASQMNVISPQNVKGTATSITTKSCGQVGIGHRQLTQNRGGRQGYGIGMGLTQPTTISVSPSSVDFVPCATSLPHLTSGLIGAGNSALTTITKPAKSVGCSATIATSPLDTGRPQKCSTGPLNTYGITPDVVVEIVPAGREDVFDIQVDRTENFIANGLVSHNTRWHEDDLVGRIMASEDAKNWRCINLPAIAEENDPLNRAVGAPLCPERFSLATLEERQRILGEGFSGLYQGNPVPRGGLFFKREWFPIVDYVYGGEYGPPERVRYWDLAASVKDTACYTSGVLMARAGSRFVVEDVIRGRWIPADRNDVIKQTAQADSARPGFRKTYFEEQPGAAGLETSAKLIADLVGHAVESDRVTGDKVTRAEPLASQAKAGNVGILKSEWTGALLSELASFPRGRFKDQIDSCSGAFNKLCQEEPIVLVGTY